MSDQSQQIRIDTLRGELREEKEVSEALFDSKRDAERILSKKIGELSDRTAERDQLRQQVEKLLGAVAEHEAEASIYCNKCGYFGPPTDEVGSHPDCNYLAGLNRRDYDLYQAADQVRKELEEHG